MTKEHEQIYSSTGDLGLTKRPDNRLYWNWARAPIKNASTVDHSVYRMRRLAQNRGETRVVFRALVEDTVVTTLPNTVLNQVEAAIKLGDYWLLYVSKNDNQRSPLSPVAKIVKETTNYDNNFRPSNKRIRDAESEGYVFISSFNQSQIPQIYELWHETFGWNEDEIEALKKRLDAEASGGGKRSVWFSGITQNGQFVTASTAERITFNAGGYNLELVENTEWKTREGFENQGLMTASIAHLNSQIIRDLRGLRYLIFAECNFMSRSDRAAFGAGFIVPKRKFGSGTIPQVLVQNVVVNDGFKPEGLRDFTFMYLPESSIREYYGEVV